MIWPFKRKPKHVGPTSVDWKPGDMAKCVAARWPIPEQCDPKVGQHLMVAEVRYSEGVFRYACFHLEFIGTPGRGYQSTCFRKITLADTGADQKVGKHKPVKVDA